MIATKTPRRKEKVLLKNEHERSKFDIERWMFDVIIKIVSDTDFTDYMD